MPELVIDGTKIEVEPGTTILEAAEQLDIDIPVFCYHPGLSPDGNCRMCIVDVEGAPKMPPSCITECDDEMVVHTKNDTVRDARAGILEFLLLNHPLDCPICDKSGECMLQDHYFEYSSERSRMVEPKVKKRKVVDVGPSIVLDTERCILCTRCIRFTEEVSKDPSLGIVNRGDHAEITTFPGQELDDPYSLNTVDICPVGALTAKDFRFEKRVWFLEEEESVCPNCSRGCNININHEEGDIYRFMPRHNPCVNDYWLCDEGRLAYEWVNADHRMEQPIVRLEQEETGEDDAGESTWETALETSSDIMSSVREEEEKSVAGWMSIRLSNEENYQFARFVREVFSDADLTFLPGEKGWLQELTEDDILRKRDKNPNRYGCRELLTECNGTSFSSWLDNAEENPPSLLISLEPIPFRRMSDEREERVRELLKRIDRVISITTHQTAATDLFDILLPGLTWAEKKGTFTNYEGRLQKFHAAFPGPGNSRYPCDILAELAGTLLDEPPSDLVETRPETLFEAFTQRVAGESWTYADLEGFGQKLDGSENEYEDTAIEVLEPSVDPETVFEE